MYNAGGFVVKFETVRLWIKNSNAKHLKKVWQRMREQGSLALATELNTWLGDVDVEAPVALTVACIEYPPDESTPSDTTRHVFFTFVDEEYIGYKALAPPIPCDYVLAAQILDFLASHGLTGISLDDYISFCDPEHIHEDFPGQQRCFDTTTTKMTYGDPLWADAEGNETDHSWMKEALGDMYWECPPGEWLEVASVDGHAA
jgi:hypothetical protein